MLKQVDEHTDVLTLDGWKRCFQIARHEPVATYNSVADRMEWHPSTYLKTELYSEEVYEIRIRENKLIFAPCHSVFYGVNHINKTNRSAWRLSYIKDVQREGNGIILYASGSFHLDERAISDDEIKIAAWFITDGSKTENSYTFWQRESKVYMITDILDRLGWSYSYNVLNKKVHSIMGKVLKSQETQICIRILNQDYIYLRELVENKHTIPGWVYELSDRQFDVFLSSFIDGDGSRHKSAPETSMMVYGVKKILDELQAACVLHGYRTSIFEYRDRDFRLNITKNQFVRLEPARKYVSIRLYNGLITSIGVPNNTLVVRRNGYVVIT